MVIIRPIQPKTQPTQKEVEEMQRNRFLERQETQKEEGK